MGEKRCPSAWVRLWVRVCVCGPSLYVHVQSSPAASAASDIGRRAASTSLSGSEMEEVRSMLEKKFYRGSQCSELTGLQRCLKNSKAEQADSRFHPSFTHVLLWVSTSPGPLMHEVGITEMTSWTGA